jgi:hypothetical protein
MRHKLVSFGLSLLVAVAALFGASAPACTGQETQHRRHHGRRCQSLGYSEVTPVSAPATTPNVLEALFGVFCFAVVVC